MFTLAKFWKGTTMISDSTIFLGPASGWSRKEGQSVLSDETAYTYPIRNTDNKNIGHVHRESNGKWAFKIFGREDIPSLYDSKEDALEGAELALKPGSRAL
jgi:hypothetical protein